jgi:hypothetical protein
MPTLSTFLAIVLAAAVAAALLSWVRRHRASAASRAEGDEERHAQIERLLRLALEISEVAHGIETDLTPFRWEPNLEGLQSRARRMRLQAEAALATRDRLFDLPWFELESQVATMHRAHLDAVALRTGVDKEIGRCRTRLRRDVEPERSSWPFLSTPMSSSFDA